MKAARSSEWARRFLRSYALRLSVAKATISQQALAVKTGSQPTMLEVIKCARS